MAYAGHTLAECRQLLQDKIEDVPFWVDIEATNAINEALLMWNAFTGFWKDTITITTTPDQLEYPLSDTLVFGTRVEFNGIPLNQSSQGDMDGGHPGWEAQSTDDGGNVPTAPKNWLPLSIDMIAIWPRDGAGNNTLTVDGVASTPQLVNDGDFIDIGDEELGTILGYALHVLALKEGGERFQSTMKYFTEFMKEAAEENDQLLESSMFRQIIGIDLNRQTRVTRGEKTDYDKYGQREP